MKTISLVALLATLLGGVTSAAQAQVAGIRNYENVLLTFHLVEADGFADVDPEIADVVEELRNLFRFEGYRLVDKSVLTANPPRDSGEPGGPRQEVVGQRLGAFAIQAYVSRAAADAVKLAIRLLDISGEYIDDNGRRRSGPAIIDASVTMRSGQTVVLGSGRPSGTENALILILSAEFDPGL